MKFCLTILLGVLLSSQIYANESARQARHSRYQQRCKSILGFFKKDFRIRNTYLRELKELERSLEDQSFEAHRRFFSPLIFLDKRREVLSLIKDSETRRIFIKDLLATMQVRSKNLSKLLIDRRGGHDFASYLEPAVVDVFGVGAGIHNQIAANTITQKDPSIKFLIADKEDIPASTFRGHFQLNSLNGETAVRDELRPGRDNLNLFPNGPFQISDIDPNLIPSSRSVREIATLNYTLSTAEILLQTEVKKIRDQRSSLLSSNWPARYQIELYSKFYRTSFYVYAHHVLDSAGLGRPNYFRGISRQTQYMLDRDSLPKEGKLPSVMQFNQFQQYSEEFPEFLEQLRGKRVAIIGAGHSSNVTVEHLLRTPLETSLGNDGRQEGIVGEILWVGQEAQNAQEFIQSNILRYHDVGFGYNLHLVKAFNNYLIDVTKDGFGRYGLVLREKRGTRQRLLANVDYIIFSTGFADHRSEIYGVEQLSTTPLRGWVHFQGDVQVGTRLVIEGNDSGIYFVGAGARYAVTDNEIGTLPVNASSILMRGPRTQVLVENLIKNRVFTSHESPTPFQPVIRRPYFILNPVANRGPVLIQISTQNYLSQYHPDMTPQGHLEDLFVKGRFYHLFSRQEFRTQIENLELHITFERDQLNFHFNASMSEAAKTYIKNEIEKDGLLIESLLRYIGPGKDLSRIALSIQWNIEKEISGIQVSML